MVEAELRELLGLGTGATGLILKAKRESIRMPLTEDPITDHV